MNSCCTGLRCCVTSGLLWFYCCSFDWGQEVAVQRIVAAPPSMILSIFCSLQNKWKCNWIAPTGQAFLGHLHLHLDGNLAWWVRLWCCGMPGQTSGSSGSTDRSNQGRWRLVCVRIYINKRRRCWHRPCVPIISCCGQHCLYCRQTSKQQHRWLVKMLCWLSIAELQRLLWGILKPVD